MRLWHMLRARMHSLLSRGRREADLREELQLHLEREAGRLRAAGVAADDARLTALQTFGGVEQIKEQCRDQRGTAAIETLVRDLRYGLRRLVRDWRFSLAAVAILGLGVGANTATFSLINAALFRTSPFTNPDRLVEIYQNDRGGTPGLNPYPVFNDVAALTDLFASTTMTSIPAPVSYLEHGVIHTAIAEYTRSTYPSVLGLHTSLGRWFDAGEDVTGAAFVAVVSHQSWRSRFGADPSIIGRIVRLEGVPVTIVGVGPANYNGTLNIGVVTDFWLPVHTITALGGPPRVLDRKPVEAPFFIKGRLRDGVTIAQAQSALDSLGARLAREYPTEDPGRGLTAMAARDVHIHPQMDGVLTAIATGLLVVVALVLAIACSNLATLLLVRAASRAREVAVRLALGATRQQIVRHLLTESLLLSAAGGAVGCLLAWWSIGLLRTIDLPVSVDVRLDGRVLAFAIVLSIATGIAFGLTPALRATRLDLLPALREGGGGTRASGRGWLTLKNALVIFQVTVSVVLLFGTSVFLEMMLAARAQKTGFAVDGVAMIQTDARYAGYTPVTAKPLFADLRRRASALPGVQATALTAGTPMATDSLPLVIDDVIVTANAIWAGPGFFETLRIPIPFGRAIDERDAADQPRVAVINEAMARKYFGGVNAVGRRFRIDQDSTSIEVVGIARDTKTSDLEGDLIDPSPYLFYRAPAQWNRRDTTLVARTTSDAAALVGVLQRELRTVDSTLPVTSARTMARLLDESLVAPATIATFLGLLGGLGLTLASIGLYAVVSFSVAQRSREIGIRMALGARGYQVALAIAREVALVVGAGTGVGLLLSMAVAPLIQALWTPSTGVAAYHPAILSPALLIIAACMATVGVAAAVVPARRAARLDPLIALRAD